MDEKIILIIVAIVVGGGIVAAIAYYIARFMRGSINLSLPITTFDPGATINGSFDLHTKKAIQGNKLMVKLIGTRVTKTRSDDGKSKTRSDEIYNEEVLVEEAKAYVAGSMAKYDFQISTPNTTSPEFMNSGVGQALSAAFRLISDKSTRFKWKVEARLDAKGVDLVDTQSITLNMKQIF